MSAGGFGGLLAQLWNLCPTENRGDSPAFRDLWHRRIDVAYAVPDAALADVLLLNREVASAASGPAGSEYPPQAARNVARILARLGEERWNTARRAVEQMDADEPGWLAWCCLWAQGNVPGRAQDLLRALPGTRPADPPPNRCDPLRRALDAWQPRDGVWQQVRECCAALVAGDAAGACAHAGVWDTNEGIHPVVGCVRRLARLAHAQSLLAAGEWGPAAEAAAACGPDGEMLAETAVARAGSIPPGERPKRAAHARFRAYQARRLAARLEALELRGAAERRRAIESQWSALAGEIEREPEA